MKKIRQMVEQRQTEETAKKFGRTYQQQEFRDDLAENLKVSRKFWSVWRKVATILLKKWKWNPTYFYSSWTRKAWKDVAESLVKSKEWTRVLACNIRHFKWLDKKIAKKLIDCWYEFEVAKDLYRFEWLDLTIAENLINTRQWWYVIKYMYKFKWLDKEIAKKFIDSDSREFVIFLNNINIFEWLDEEVAKKMTEKWYWEYVANHPENFWLKKEK